MLKESLVITKLNTESRLKIPSCRHPPAVGCLAGIVGRGKQLLYGVCLMFWRKKVILVSKSLSVDKDRATLGTLITACSTICQQIRNQNSTLAKNGNRATWIKKGKKPRALFVDEAHDLHHTTLTGLKRLIEVVEDGGGTPRWYWLVILN